MANHKSPGPEQKNRGGLSPPLQVRARSLALLIAGDGFGGLFGCEAPLPLHDVPLPLAGAMVTGLPALAKFAGTALAMSLNGADLDHRRLGLLQNQLFVDGANLGLLFESLLAAGVVFLGGGQGDVVLEMANAGGVIGVDLQGVLEALEIDASCPWRRSRACRGSCTTRRRSRSCTCSR